MASTMTVADALDIIDSLYVHDDGNKSFTATAKYHALRMGAQDAYRAVSRYDPNQLRKSYTVPFVAATVEYALPLDFLRAERVKVNPSGSTGVSPYTIPLISYGEDTNLFDSAYIRARFIGLRLSGSSGSVILDYIAGPFGDNVTPGNLVLPTALAQTFTFDDNWVQLACVYAAQKLLGGKGLASEWLMRESHRLESELSLTYPSDRDQMNIIGLHPYQSEW